MSRLLPDWLAAYLKYADNTEPPVSYHTWTGLSLIAGTLQRRVYMKWGHDTIYPNMYIVLVGPSGRCRKGTALGLGREILRHVQAVTLTSESITREGLIRAMKKCVVSFTDPSTGDIKFQCPISLISPELQVFLREKDRQFLANLTDWYDSNDVWTYETKTSGIDRIEGVCFNIIGGTAPDWLQAMLPQEAVGGGFTARCMYIMEMRKRKIVAHHDLTEAEKELGFALTTDLEQIATLSGEMRFSPEADEAYQAWYIRQEEKILKGEMPIDDPRFAAYCDRRATHIKKLCMSLTVARGDLDTIELQDFERAKKILHGAEINMPRVFGGLGRALYSEVTQEVLEYIMIKGKVTRSELMRVFYRDMDGNTLKVVEEVMEYMKVVKINRNMLGGEVTYEFIGK